MALGKQIRRHRAARGWTLDQLSDASGVDVGTISALEMRDSSRSKYSTALAAALGLTVEQLENSSIECQTASENITPPPIASEKVVQIGRRSTDECPAISEIISLMHGMDDAGRWILVGAARQIATQHPVNKQASSSQ